MVNNNNYSRSGRCELCDEQTSINENELCVTCQVDENEAKARFELEQAREAIIRNTTPTGVHPYDPSVVEQRREIIGGCRRLVRRGFSIS